MSSAQQPSDPKGKKTAPQRAPLGGRLFVLIFLVGLGVLTAIGWQGVQQISDRLDRWFDAPRGRSLGDLNAPPKVDPRCPDRLARAKGVAFTRAAGFERQAGCRVAGALYVDQLAGLTLRPQGALMRCEVAEELNAWLAEAVIPQAMDQLGARPSAVGHLGTYNCRTISGSSGVLSQHSFANAIDIAWFDFDDGRRHRLIDGWTSSETAIQDFWKRIHRLSCKYFDVSLGPSYNRAHADHFHFDLGPLRACR